MAQIEHYFAAATDRVSLSSGTAWEDSPSGSHIASGNLTAGDRYLIVATCQHGITSAAREHQVRLVHGSTEFSGSVAQNESNKFGSHDAYDSYLFMTAWTAVADEDVKLQFSRVSTATAYIDQCTIFVLNLDALTENTNYWYAEDTDFEDVTSDRVYQDSGASVTFTPETTGDHLVIFGARMDIYSVHRDYQVRLKSSGTVNDTEPEYIQRSEDTAETRVLYGMRVLHDLSVLESQTINVQYSAQEAFDHSHEYSSIFVLDLAVFESHTASTYDTENQDLTESWTTLDTITHSASTGEHWILGCGRTDYVSGDESKKRGLALRLQADDSDIPDTGSSSDSWTSDERIINVNDPQSDGDTRAFHVQALKTQSASTVYEIDVYGDGRGDIDDPQWAADQHQMVAISMELATAGVTANANLATSTVTAHQPSATAGVTGDANLATSTVTAHQPSATAAGVTGDANLASSTVTAFTSTTTGGITIAVLVHDAITIPMTISDAITIPMTISDAVTIPMTISDAVTLP